MARIPIPSALASSNGSKIASRAPHANCDSTVCVSRFILPVANLTQTARSESKQRTNVWFTGIFSECPSLYRELGLTSCSAGRCWPTFGPCAPCCTTQCRTVLAHVWTMRPLLYYTVQDGAGPHLDHAPLAVLHSAGRYWPTFGPCAPCCITPVVILHKQNLHTTHDYWQGYIWTLPAATSKWRNTSLSLLLNVQSDCRLFAGQCCKGSPVFSMRQERITLRLARGQSLPFSFPCAVSVTVQDGRTDRQTYGSRNIGPAVSSGSVATERQC